jgi:hypothetical protein
LMTINNPHLTQTVASLAQGLAAKMGLPLQAGQGITNYLLYGLAMKQSTIDGINDAFWWATIGTVIALILSLFVRRVKVEKSRPMLPKPEDQPNAGYLVESKEPRLVHT